MSLALLLAGTLTVAVTWPLHLGLVSLPARIAALGFVGFGVAGAFFYKADAQALRDNPGPTAYFQTLTAGRIIGVFTVAGACILAGALAARTLLPKARTAGAADARLTVNVPAVALLLPAAVIAFEGAAVGPATLISAPTYLAHTGPLILLKLADGLGPFAVIVAAIVAFGRGQSRAVKVCAVILLVTLELLFVARASRSAAAFVLYVFVGAWLTGRWTTRQAAARGTAAFAAAYTLIGVPLQLRTGPQYGLTAALHYLIADPGRFVTGTASPLNNVLLGVPLCMYEGFATPAIPAHVFWISVSPLPSSHSDFLYWSGLLRLLPTEPYSGFGELLNMGWGYVAAFFLAAGFAFELLSFIGERARGNVVAATRGIVVGLAVLFVTRSTQYQLRTEAQYVYYAAALVTVLTVWSRVAHSSAPKSARPRRPRRLARSLA